MFRSDLTKVGAKNLRRKVGFYYILLQLIYSDETGLDKLEQLLNSIERAVLWA